MLAILGPITHISYHCNTKDGEQHISCHPTELRFPWCSGGISLARQWTGLQSPRTYITLAVRLLIAHILCQYLSES